MLWPLAHPVRRDNSQLTPRKAGGDETHRGTQRNGQ